MSEKSCPYCGMAIPAEDVRVCPKCQTEIVRDDEPPSTRLQSVADLRAELRGLRTPTQLEPAPAPAFSQASPFRPVHRPPMAILCLHHDGCGVEGQEIPVRDSEFVIGRTEGDVVIPHDDMISKRHTRLLRRLENGHYCWFVQDLGSTNGTFALIDEGVLRQGQELLLGGGRYRFDINPGADAGGLGETVQRGQTSAWQSLSSSPGLLAPPALVELTPGGDGRRFEIGGKEAVLGTDPAHCNLVISGDRFLSPTHARLFLDPRGRWVIKPVEALNGVWVRIRAIRVERSGRFQMGEQRFSVRIP